ncbi:hypothetical protein [Streptomyces sp. NPDC020747]|uniref:hypothetical protein n=1 Tax=Streptomyces sp. NPDC020747 TaxID=3365086 RepID=UPI0037905BB9
MSDEAAGGAREPAVGPAEPERPAPKNGAEPGRGDPQKARAKDADAKDDKESMDDGADQEKRERELRERERAESLFREVGSDPREEGERDAADAAATAQAHRSARASFDIRRDQHNFHRPEFHAAHFGDINLSLESLRATAVFSGPVPEEELERLRRVYQEPAGFGDLEQALRARRLLVLVAAPGSGRTCTALVLLDQVTATAPDPEKPRADPFAPRVSRLDPRTVLSELTADNLKERGTGHGFVLEIPEGNDGTLMPAEVHLDALAAALKTWNSYAVVIVASGAATTALLSGRYGVLCPAAPTDELLASRLEEHLASLSAEAGADSHADALRRATELAYEPDVSTALGLEELRPAEAETLADLLAGHILGRLSRDDLLAGCGGLADRQAHAWFTGLDREIGSEYSPGVPSAAAVMYPAAFRIALSVFNGSTHGIVAETAHALAWELAVSREPERAPARPLFCDDQSVALGLSRAALAEGRVLVADVPVPVRTVRFRGGALPTAVLKEVWTRHHAARAPVVRWLRSFADDPRPQVRIRAAVAAGELCVHDFEHGFEQLIRPMATASGARRRMFAAAALDQAARHDSHRAGIQALVRAWAGAESSPLRWTAAVTLGYGHATTTVGSALDLLARIATRDDGEHLSVVSHSTVLLAAGSDDMTVLRRVATWVQGRRRDRQDQNLGLLSVARLAATRVGDIWDDSAAPDLAEYQKWPLALALTVAREGRTVPVADLLWHALRVLRSREAVGASLSAWIRQAAEEDGEEMSAGLDDLLPLLVDDSEDREQLRWLINRMVEDEDDPLPTEQARRIWRTVEPGPAPRADRERERV